MLRRRHVLLIPVCLTLLFGLALFLRRDRGISDTQFEHDTEAFREICADGCARAGMVRWMCEDYCGCVWTELQRGRSRTEAYALMGRFASQKRGGAAAHAAVLGAAKTCASRLRSD